MTTIINNESGEIVQQGGVTRINHHQAEPSPLQVAHESTKVGGTVYRTGADGSIQESGVARYQMGVPDPQNVSVMATYERHNGKGTVELIPGYPGSRTIIEQAVKQGLIEPAGDGNFRDVRRAQPASEADATAPAEDRLEDAPQDEERYVGPDDGFFDEAENKAFAEDIKPLPQHAYDAAVALGTIASLDGTDLSRVEDRLVRDGGLDHETAAQMAESVYDMYAGVVQRAMVPEGIEAASIPAFFEFCRTRPRELQGAIGTLTAARDLTGFRHLAALYRGSQRGRE